MILLLVLVFFLLNYIMNNKETLREQFGSDFFHRSFLSGLGIEQRKNDLKKIYDFYGMKENFDNDTVQMDKIIESKKLGTVISELPKNELKNELKNEFELEDLKYDDQKHITKEEVKLSEYQEVNDYNTGSGDINDLKKVYLEKEKQDYKNTLEMLDSRGGNVHIVKND